MSGELYQFRCRDRAVLDSYFSRDAEALSGIRGMSAVLYPKI